MSDYYEYFDRIANGGYVFDDDLSSETLKINELSVSEKKERAAWQKDFKKIYKHYSSSREESPKVDSLEALLEQRLIAPILANRNVTVRTKINESRSGRMYPPPSAVCLWSDFVKQVSRYEPPAKKLVPFSFNVFPSALVAGEAECRSETEEQNYVVTNALQVLRRAQVVHEIKLETGTVGKPDFTLMKNARIMSVVGESKSTDNLLLPHDSKDLLRKYGPA